MLLVLVAATLFFLWASASYRDAPGTLRSAASNRPIPTELGVLAYNIGYARGPAGDNSGPWTEAHIKKGLDDLAAEIAATGADLVFLQEVDLDAARTHGIDQGEYLRGKLGFGSASCVTTWNKNYVPFPYWPPSKHYGHMVSGQCVLSRYLLGASRQHTLPQPESNPWWRNAFYLERAIDEVTLYLDDARTQPVTVYNVHLEAFDVPNRERHAQTLADLIKKAPTGGRIIVAGDFNAPPPEAAQKKGFVDEPETDFTDDDTIATLRATGLNEVLPDADVFTFPADAPTRRLDYIWFGDAFEKLDAHVVKPAGAPHSDHLAVFARFRLR